MTKKTTNVLKVLKYIDELDLTYDELDKVIEECEMLLDSKSEENG